MPGVMMLAAVAAFAAGCATHQPGPAPVPVPAADPAAAGQPIRMTVVTGVGEGRVSVADIEHGFVVVDYGTHPVPPIGTTVNVYRGDDRKIGQVRLTEPRQGRLVSADILEGQPQIGDVARQETTPR